MKLWESQLLVSTRSKEERHCDLDLWLGDSSEGIELQVWCLVVR